MTKQTGQSTPSREMLLDSLDGFISRYVTFHHGSHPLGQIPFLRTYLPDLTDTFFRLHDRFGEADAAYRKFRDEYSRQHGALQQELCSQLAQSILAISLGDVDGLFTPLDTSVDSMARACSSYHLVPWKTREAYEQKLFDVVAAVHGPRVSGKIQLRENSWRSGLPEELWRLHLHPEQLFTDLLDVLYCERLAGTREDLTGHEYAVANFEDTETDFVRSHNLFVPDAAVVLQHQYGPLGYTIHRSVPSLRVFRGMLPATLDPATLFKRPDGMGENPVRTVADRIVAVRCYFENRVELSQPDGILQH